VCYSLWYNVLAGNIADALYHSCNTQSNVPEDGQNNCPKHVELIGIVNKPSLLHLVGCLYYCYFIVLSEIKWRSKYRNRKLYISIRDGCGRTMF